VDKEVSAEKVTFELFDFNTSERKGIWTQQNGYGRHSLKRGLYILTVTKGKSTSSKKVIIQ